MNEKMLSYFDEKIALHEEKRNALLADDRADEADFERIRANVFDIFRTVYLAGERSQGENAAEFFFAKLRQIPENWRVSLQSAKEHGDAEKTCIETVKLGAADEICRDATEILGAEK